MNGLLQLAGKAEPCEEQDDCKNRPSDNGDFCRYCRFASQFPGRYDRWSPVEGSSKKHPAIMRQKRASKQDKRRVAAEAKAGRDKSRMEVQRLARAAEKRTEKVITSTYNSGRSNKDGDHVLEGSITMDTKNQMNNIHPVVKIGELIKVTQDAVRAGQSFGALCIRNKYKQGVVVMFEEDFTVLLRKITRKP